MMHTISPDFPFEANYVEVNGSRMFYVDEGSGDPILFLHGNPTSSYLWRNVIPHLTNSGRCIAPDLIGMGQSDKPDINYRFFDHAGYLDGFIQALGLTNITLVIHDWGSGLGFHYAQRNPENVKAIVFMEAIVMPTPGWEVLDEQGAQLFKAFRTPGVGEDMLINQNMFIEQILPQSVMRPLSEEEMNAYRAPYLEPAARKPIHRWPSEIPIGGSPADVHDAVAAYNQWLQETDTPKLMLTVTPGVLVNEYIINWCKQSLSNLTVTHLGEGLHYIQEDHPDKIGTEIAGWLSSLK
ncbi:MAG: haloalkane dehalogenase [Chloroflexota bacterium]